MITKDQIIAYAKQDKFRQALSISADAELAFEMLAQGECNQNYTFVHPETGKKLVFRVNLVSQMHLRDQTAYEYRALKALEASCRTPHALYMDSYAAEIGHGVMVYEYLPGRPLSYRTDLLRAASLLADIHSIPAGEAAAFLLAPEDPLSAILEECEAMVETYMRSPLSDPEVRTRIRRMLDRGHRLLSDAAPYTGYRCMVNTELNSGNFLINDGEGGRDYLIDWEKPVYGDPVQDLGHFLAPTTTFWKTDVILREEEMALFLEQYLSETKGKFETEGIRERLRLYLAITCLRGMTWCAMAWVQYQDEKSVAPKNADTWKKLCAYLDLSFLEDIEEKYFS